MSMSSSQSMLPEFDMEIANTRKTRNLASTCG